MRQLEVDQDLEYERRSWRIQRISWIGGCVTLFAATMGVFGGGFLSRGRTVSPDGATLIQYERFARLFAPVELRVLIAPQVSEGGRFQLRFDRTCLEDARFVDISPAPVLVVAAGNQVFYTFEVQGVSESISVVIRQQFESWGAFACGMDAVRSGAGRQWASRCLAAVRLSMKKRSYAMDSIVRVAAMYGFLLLVFRLSGKRTLGESTTFDLLMLLVISETTQQALLGEDHSMTHAFLMILTFVGMDVVLSLIKQRFRAVERMLEDLPVLILEDGRPFKKIMDKSRVDEHDIMEAARLLQGLERMDQIRYAVLERNGRISIVPKKGP